MKSQKKAPNRLLAITFFVLLPFFLLGITELGLRVFGYGYDFSPLVPAEGNSAYLVDNPDLHRKYYASISKAGAEATRPNLITKVKDPNTLRGFVLGESTPQGFPFNTNQGFPKMAEAALNKLQNRKLEIVNLSKTAMTSYYIRDVAPKLMEYSPDFVVIYVGHNEYYGNFSASTGGNHFTRLVSLGLREFRLGQWFNDLVAPKEDVAESLMSTRFSGSEFPQDQERDKQVVNDYLDNLKTAVNFFTDRKVPVILFVPASNLVGLPPFRGVGEEKNREAYNKVNALLGAQESNPVQLAALAEEISKSNPKDPHGIWLQGLVQIMTAAGKGDLKLFEAAKDMDAVPFRARSQLTEALKKEFTNKPQVVLLDLPKDIENQIGLPGFSNLFFIDHVHFTSPAQTFVAGRLTKSLNDTFKLGISNPSLAAWYSAPQKSQQEVFYNPFDEIIAMDKIAQLVTFEPFKSMAIAYPDPLTALKVNPLYQDPKVVEILRKSGVQESLPNYLRYLSESGKNEEILGIITSQAYQNPGDYFAQKDLLKIIEQVPGMEPLVEDLKAKLKILKKS